MSFLGTLDTIHIEDGQAGNEAELQYELNVAKYGIYPLCRDCPAGRYGCRRNPNGPTLKILFCPRVEHEASQRR